jgi:cytochrome c
MKCSVSSITLSNFKGVILKYLKRTFWLFALFVFTMSIYTFLFHPDYGGPFTSERDSQIDLINRGEKIYSQKNCSACHGYAGKSPVTNTFPKLAGNNKLYLEAQILDIMNSYRTNGMSTQMKESIGKLTKEEVKALAAYLANAD